MIDYKEPLLRKLMLKNIKILKEKLCKDLWTENNERVDSHLYEQRGNIKGETSLFSVILNIDAITL